MKKFVFTLFIFVLITLALLVALPLFIDANDYKDKIVSIIEKQTGRKVKINGLIKPSILPNLNLTLNDVDVYSSTSDKSKIASLSEFVIHIKLKPLFEKRIEVDSFKLVQPKITYKIMQDGSSNWDIPGLASVVDNKKVSDKPRASKEDSDIKILFNDVRIENATFEYIDAQSGTNININNINAITSYGSNDNPFTLTGKVNYFTDEKLGKFSLKGKYAVQMDSFYVKDLLFDVDGIEGHGSVNVNNAESVPYISSVFNLKKITVDPYLTKSLANNAAHVEKQQSAQALGPVKNKGDFIDLSGLKGFNADVTLVTEKFSYQDIVAKDVDLKAYLRSGILVLDLHKLSAFEGDITGKYTIDASRSVNVFKSVVQVAGINIAKTPDSWDVNKYLSGDFNFSSQVETRGNYQNDIVNNLAGKAKLDASGGIIKGVDLLAMADNLAAAFQVNPGLSLATKFEKMSADFSVSEGKVTTDNMLLISPKVDFAGTGGINLNDLNVEFRIVPQLKRGADAKSAPRIPIIVSGVATNPKFKLDTAVIIEDLIRNPGAAEDFIKDIGKDGKGLGKNIEESIKDGSLINNLLKGL